MLNPKSCIVLVPFRGAIAAECDRSLRTLERMGYRVERVGTFSAIDQGRCQMATDAMRRGYEETMWIDSDIAFNPADVEQLRSADEPVICGVYPVKGKQALACHVLPGTTQVHFGRTGSVMELLYGGAGFLLVKRQVYQTMHERLKLPVCNEQFGPPLIPFFAPLQIETDRGYWYLAEDFAFCHRARQCGYRIMADTRVRLHHLGTRVYGWESPTDQIPRFDSFTLTLNDSASNLEPKTPYPLDTLLPSQRDG